jgi:hAT family C-terminal dimerisation region
VNNYWATLDKYYNLTDHNHSVYAAATLLHPGMRMRHFYRNWTGHTSSWISVMEANCRDTWRTEFLPLVPSRQQSPDSEDTFLHDLMGLPIIDKDKDEFELYTHHDPTFISNPKTFNPIAWWNDSRQTFPSLHLYAFDTLAIPAMSAECERVFSSTKKLITPERNRLAEDIIEASECLKNWWDRGLIEQQDDGTEV